MRKNARTFGTVRRCQNCFRTRPLTDFYRKLNGYQYRCKDCNAEVVAGYAQRRRELQTRAGWDSAFARRDAQPQLPRREDIE